MVHNRCLSDQCKWPWGHCLLFDIGEAPTLRLAVRMVKVEPAPIDNRRREESPGKREESPGERDELEKRDLWYWDRTRDKASHDPIPIPLGYRGHETWSETWSEWRQVGIRLGDRRRLFRTNDGSENASQVAEIVNGVYGADTVTANYVQFWFRRIRSDIFDVKEAPHTGRPLVENVDETTEIIENDRYVSSRSITQQLKIDPKTVLNHLHKVEFKKKLDVWVRDQLIPKT
ncbi:histone-lysine N-methyltransferase SETMAR [Trichonephila clavipes]|nr:histone-lysine N-methyltransferase SETMAR [Trichonephila clavipes]